MAVCEACNLDKGSVVSTLLDIKDSVDYKYKGQTKDLCNDCIWLWNQIDSELKN